MSLAAPHRPLLRGEDLDHIALPGKKAEIREGELVVMTPARHRHNRIALEFALLFREFCRTRPELSYGGDNEGFVVRREPLWLLSPDACLFRRRPEGTGAWFEFSPEIVVEVVSPSNTRAELELKRERYFDAGTEQFWIADPDALSIEMRFPDGRVRREVSPATVEAEGIVAGLAIPLAEVFREP